MSGEPRRVRIPGDKSITHRALMFGALATGRSSASNLLGGEDARSTAACLRSLGCSIPAFGGGAAVTFDGLGLRGLRAPAAKLDCGNSGTTTRLLLGMLAGQSLRAVLDGDASLRSRPMRRVTRPLEMMGARFEEFGEADRLPLAIEGGGLDALEFESPHASAQVKSAILLAGLTAGVRVSVIEPVLSRDHTERLLGAMGVRIATTPTGDGRVRIDLEPGASIDPLDIVVPGDFSSAAFFLGYGLLVARAGIRMDGVGVNPTRTGLLDVLHRMGGRVELSPARDSGGEPVADIEVVRGGLTGVRVEAAEIPALIDEVPILAVIAARAAGETRIEGAGELRVKESDRLAAIAENLRAVGVEAVDEGDTLLVNGREGPLRGRVRSFGDHRIAMAFGILGAEAGNDFVIDDPDVAGVSFPGFWEALAAGAT